MSLENIRFVSSAAYGQNTSVGKKSLEKDDFLRLLVAQMANQDPLDPVSNQEFVAQLAQFASLEQLSNMNESLTQDIQWNYLLSQTISNTMATSLIGREVRADSSRIYLETEGSADVAVNLDKTASELTIKILDSNGRVVRTINERGLDYGDHVFHWDGTDDNGVQMASGVYSIEVTALDSDGDSFTPDNYLEGIVEGVAYVDGMAMLTINGQNIPLSSVQEVRMASEE